MIETIERQTDLTEQLHALRAVLAQLGQAGVPAACELVHSPGQRITAGHLTVAYADVTAGTRELVAES